MKCFLKVLYMNCGCIAVDQLVPLMVPESVKVKA